MDGNRLKKNGPYFMFPGGPGATWNLLYRVVNCCNIVYIFPRLHWVILGLTSFSLLLLCVHNDLVEGNTHIKVVSPIKDHSHI